MNRNELIRKIARQTGLTKAVVSTVVNTYENVIVDAIQNNEQIHLHGFMNIERGVKKEHKGRNFGDGSMVVIPAHEYIKIRPGTALTSCI